jgi:hypothetical protein
MSGQDPVLAIDQHRIGEAKAADAFRDLPDLLSRMDAGVTRPGPQTVNGQGFKDAGGHWLTTPIRGSERFR